MNTSNLQCIVSYIIDLLVKACGLCLWLARCLSSLRVRNETLSEHYALRDGEKMPGQCQLNFTAKPHDLQSRPHAGDDAHGSCVPHCRKRRQGIFHNSTLTTGKYQCTIAVVFHKNGLELSVRPQPNASWIRIRIRN